MAAPLIKFVKGNPNWMDIIPSASTDAGTPVVLGAAGPNANLAIPHSPVVNGEEMGMAVEGGIYEVILGATLGDSALVGFDISAGKALAAANAACDGFLGVIVPGYGGGDNDVARVYHQRHNLDNT